MTTQGLPVKTIFLGPSGAGKSTIITELENDFTVSTIDVQPFIKEYEKKHGDISAAAKHGIYRSFIQALHLSNHDILEIANGHPKSLFPHIISRFCKEKDAVAIYVDACFDTCMERVSTRDSPTPESTMVRHHQYSADYFAKRLQKHNVPLHRVDGEKPFPEKYREVQRFFHEHW